MDYFMREKVKQLNNFILKTAYNATLNSWTPGLFIFVQAVTSSGPFLLVSE